jgi:hypothetical protein
MVFLKKKKYVNGMVFVKKKKEYVNGKEKKRKCESCLYATILFYFVFCNQIKIY